MIAAANEKLKTATHARQKAMIRGSDGVARAIDADTLVAWDRLVRAGNSGSANVAAGEAKVALHQWMNAMQASMERGLTDLIHWGARNAADNWINSVPLDVWKLKLQQIARQHGRHVLQREGLQEMLRDPNRINAGPLDVSAESPDTRDMSAEQVRSTVRGLVFPPPSSERVQQILHDGSLWPDRVAWPQRLASEGLSFNSIIQAVTRGVTQGMAPRQFASTLEPLVDGVRYRAMRIARTEGLRVADQTQRDSWQQTADMTAGYEMVATLDRYTRIAHRLRNGRIYWMPGHVRGPWTVAMMPALPDECNCRCILVPILLPLEAL